MAGIALGLALLGCVLLSLSMRRHYRQVFPDDSLFQQRFLAMRVVGYACAALALWPCVRTAGWPIGTCLWLATLALAAFGQIMVLTYRPRRVYAVGSAGLLLILAGLVA